MSLDIEVQAFGKGGEAHVSFANQYGLSEALSQKPDILQQLRKLGNNLEKYKANFGDQADQTIGSYIREFQNYYNITVANAPILALGIVLYETYSKQYNQQYLYDQYIMTKISEIMIGSQDDPTNELLFAQYQADVARYWLAVIGFMS